MTMPVSAETYHDLVVEVGRTHLENLTASVGAQEVVDGVVGWSHDIERPKESWHALEYSTTYRTSVYPNIDKSILRHPNPPKYFYTIVNALTESLVDYHNNARPSRSPIMRPHDEDLRLQLDTSWASLAESNPFVEGDEITLFETPPYDSYRLQMARRAGMLALEFAQIKRYAKLHV